MSLEYILLIGKEILGLYAQVIPPMLVLAAVFTAFSIFQSQASTPGKVWWRSPDVALDVTYALGNTLLAPYLSLPAMVLVTLSLSSVMTAPEVRDYISHGKGPLSVLPFWWQALAFFAISDFISYWIHRVFHGGLWRFHAIHHSGEQVDWTTAYRFHPVNIMLQPAFLTIVMLSLGVAPEVFAYFIPLEALAATWAHSNCNWTLGPLKYIIVTPVFHRWHHSSPEEGGNSNFSTTFSFWDLLFGTFYMPEGKLPQTFGIDDHDFPKQYFAQLAYPFRVKGKDSVATAQFGPVSGS